MDGTNEMIKINSCQMIKDAAVSVYKLIFCSNIGALVEIEYLMIIRDNFCKFCIKTYVVTPHLNHLKKTVQMKGHNIWFQ